MNKPHIQLVSPILLKTLIYVGAYAFTIGLLISVMVGPSTEQGHYPLMRLIVVFFSSILLTKYFFYMFLSPWDDVYQELFKKKRGLSFEGSETPRVSVLVPAWNEEVGVATTLKTLLQSDYLNTEIILIDNASTDRTREKAMDFIKTYYDRVDRSKPHVAIMYCYEGRQGKGYALNNGIERAEGDIVISIDADCSVTRRTISEFVAVFADPTVKAAVGNVKIGNTKTIIGIIQYLEFLFSFYFKKGDSLMNTIYIIGGAAGAFRREVFEKIGCYSTKNITEDIELSMRVQDAGMKIVYAPRAIVYTEGAATFSALLKQRLRWKRGRFETFFANRDLFFSTKQKHNKLLTCLLLPLALFGEIQLFCELFFLGFLYVYSYVTGDFSSFISGIIIVASMFFIQIFFDNRGKNAAEFYLLAPIGWLLFYLTTFIEFRALIESLWGYARGTEPKWQKWQRQGVFLK